MKEWIYGRNPVFETISAGRRQVFQLLVNQSAQIKGRLSDIVDLCTTENVPINRVPRQVLDAITQNHQGVAVQVSDYPYKTIYDILQEADSKNDLPFILILDTLQDPQNLATLLRTAEIVGVHGVLLPYRKTVTITPTVVNASSGASEHLLISQVNLAQAIKQLKSEGIWVIGLAASKDSERIELFELNRPIAMVVGSEGHGMRPLIKRSCDALLQIPMRGQIDSLNAAIAGSVGLYFAWQSRGYAGNSTTQS